MPAAELTVEVGEILEAARITNLGDRADAFTKKLAGMAKADVVESLGKTASRRTPEKAAECRRAQAGTCGEVGLKDRFLEVGDQMTIDGVDPGLASSLGLRRIAR